MAYRYRKPYRVKRKKPILRSRIFRTGILITTVAGAVIYFLFFSEFFQIQKIILTGDKIFSEENISTLIAGKNIFLVDINDIEKEILGNFPQAAKVKIRRNFPDTLNISTEKRMPVALWCESETCFLTDKDGVIFQESQNETSLIKISGKKEMLSEEKIAQILDIQTKLSALAGVTTTEAIIVSKERLNIKISEGWEIYFNTEGNLDWQIQELALVLEKQISPEKRKNLEYIDLRFSRVYYK